MGLLVELDLSSNNFSGEVPPELGANLVNLQILKLSANKFCGELFSDHFNLTWLRDLHLDNNKFSGLSNALPRFFALELLDASNNIISGKIPSWIGDFRVSQLDLSSNNLTGEIPPEIGSLGSIQEFNSSFLYALNLSHNQLAGSIPKNFSNMREIRSLDLSYNTLSGVIPPELTDLQLLEFFSLAHNNLTGRIPNIEAQAGAFDSSSYEGNPFLCGPPLRTRCRA